MRDIWTKLRSYFLGSNASFRNAHRTGLYLGFLVLVVVLVVIAQLTK